jgi:hypothetical protein
MTTPQELDLDDAINFIIKYLREGRSRRRVAIPAAYDVQIDSVARNYLAESGVPEHQLKDAHVSPERQRHLSLFLTAASELCRRGVLRPGVATFVHYATASWSGGTGFSVTPYGEEWLHAADEIDLVPIQPGRFARMLAQAGSRFGQGFVERGEQAVASYNGRAFLACCAMCGAASESIILALAIAKKGSEEPILKMYAGATGRGRVEGYLLGSQTTLVREEFGRYTGLLKHWRDDSAHGRAVRISEPEAYSALALLLRFALWAEGRWTELVSQTSTNEG